VLSEWNELWRDEWLYGLLVYERKKRIGIQQFGPTGRAQDVGIGSGRRGVLGFRLGSSESMNICFFLLTSALHCDLY
jgi:hypothetical protein